MSVLFYLQYFSIKNMCKESALTEVIASVKYIADINKLSMVTTVIAVEYSR